MMLFNFRKIQKPTTRGYYYLDLGAWKSCSRVDYFKYKDRKYEVLYIA